MSIETTSEKTQPGQTDGGHSHATEGSTRRTGGHSMKWMLPCVLAMIVGVVGFGVWGIDIIAGLGCALMMIAMVWMMAAPAVAKVRQNDHERR